jgi:ubiquinone/menaquinone biosynthesis C-methylase UbiE
LENYLQYDPTLFQGTARYYSAYRFPYPNELFQHIAQRFQLDKNSQVLDLGCGTGNLSIPLASYCQKVIGMDTDPEMIKEAKRLVSCTQIENIEWVLGSSWDISNEMGPFQATIIGEAFHWMDRENVLRSLYDVTVPYGGITIVSKKQVGPSGYQEVVDQVIKQFLGEKRKAGKGFYAHPSERYEEVLSRSEFSILNPWSFEYRVDRTIEDLIGFLYSTSYASKRLLGDEVESFEKELRHGLLSVEPTGKLSFHVTITALMGQKEGREC